MLRSLPLRGFYQLRRLRKNKKIKDSKFEIKFQPLNLPSTPFIKGGRMGLLPFKKRAITFFLISIFLPRFYCLADDSLSRIETVQNSLKDMPLGKRIAFWAEAFLGRPYDTDPLGEYVRKGVIVADERVDCMYHTFRSVELALSSTPEEAIENALRLRFFTKGILRDGKVINYEDRYQYGEDMIDSGKWGIEITTELGKIIEIKGSREKEKVSILPKEEAFKEDIIARLKDGDIIYFIKDPEKRIVGEIVGHIGIIKIKGGIPFLIHASGVKDNKDIKGGGSVKEIRLSDYLRDMNFIGIRVTRF